MIMHSRCCIDNSDTITQCKVYAIATQNFGNYKNHILCLGMVNPAVCTESLIWIMFLMPKKNYCVSSVNVQFFSFTKKL